MVRGACLLLSYLSMLWFSVALQIITRVHGAQNIKKTLRFIFILISSFFLFGGVCVCVENRKGCADVVRFSICKSRMRTDYTIIALLLASGLMKPHVSFCCNLHTQPSDQFLHFLNPFHFIAFAIWCICYFSVRVSCWQVRR